MLAGQQPPNPPLAPANAGGAAPWSRIHQIMLDHFFKGSGQRALIDASLTGTSMVITALASDTNHAESHAETVTSGPTASEILFTAAAVVATIEATRATYNASQSPGSILHKAKKIAIKTGQGAWTGLSMGIGTIAVAAMPILNDAQKAFSAMGPTLVAGTISYLINPLSWRGIREGRAAIRSVNFMPPPPAQGQVAINIAPPPPAPVNPPAVIPVAPPLPAPAIVVARRTFAPRRALEPNVAAAVAHLGR